MIRMAAMSARRLRMSASATGDGILGQQSLSTSELPDASARKRQTPDTEESIKAVKRGRKRVEKTQELLVNQEASVDTERTSHATVVTPFISAETENFDSDAKTKDGRPWNFKISSWNVSGIRAWVKKEGLAFLAKENPDILVLQEVKCSEAKLPEELKNVPGYHHKYWWSHKSKSGYSGVGILTKTEPISVAYGLGIEKHDHEGRLITAEYEKFYLVGVYVPNSGDGLRRLPYRREWNADFLAYLKRLDAVKPVICAGDLNVAHHPIDLARPKSNEGCACFTKEEREDFSAWLDSGFIDSFRYLYPDKAEAYSFWSYRTRARGRNVGWRLDYFVLSERLAGHLCDSVMRSKVLGSDHCPLTLFMAF